MSSHFVWTFDEIQRLQEVEQLLLVEINRVFELNLKRANNLASIFGKQVAGRRSVADTDVLRSAVVLLHAGMEDYLRSLMVWKIEIFSEDTLNNYNFRFDDNKSKEKISLGELAKFRGKSVNDVIAISVKAHLDLKQSFSDLGEVKKALKLTGIAIAKVDAHDFGKITDMISRRHNIVHKADKNLINAGRGQHRAKSISKKTVEVYLADVERLRSFVFAELV